MDKDIKYEYNYELIKRLKNNKLKFNKFSIGNIKILQDLVKLEGRQSKYWNNNKSYKLDDENWTQSLSESIVSTFLSVFLDESEFVEYYNDKKKSGNYAVSENFIPEGYQEKTFADVLNSHGYSNFGDFFSFKDSFNNIDKEFDEILNLVKEDYCVDFKDYFMKLLAIDCITLNVDRHMGNINFFVNTNGDIKEGLIFDNGASLMSDFDAMYKNFTNKEAFIDVIETGSITFSSGNFNDTLDFLIRNNFKPFKINYNKLIKMLSYQKMVQEYEGYTDKQINRSINVLISRLNETKNKLWIEEV